MLKRFRYQIAIFLSVVGPGLITANVDNDSGGILTYSQAGAKYGYLPLWTLIPITLLLIVTQEMCSRMGAVTGKGLSDLIREEFGLRTTFFLMIALVLTNFTNVIAEFAGIASSLELFHISRYISVPICAVAVWLLVVRGNYRSVEKVFLVACCSVRDLYYLRVSAEAGLEAGGHLQREADSDVRHRLHHHADRHGGHIHCAVDAVLFAVGHCRERDYGQRIRAVAD